MSVATFEQPLYGVQQGSAYPLAIDASMAVVAEVAAGFAVHETDPAALQIVMDAGKIPDASTRIPIVIGQQTSAVLTAPAGNPRHDIVYHNAGGTLGIAQGAEAGAPADPVVPIGSTAVARIVWTVAAPAVTNAMIQDLRLSGGGLGGAVELIETYDGPYPVGGVAFNVGFDSLAYSKHLIVASAVLPQTDQTIFNAQFKFGGSWSSTPYRYTQTRLIHGSSSPPAVVGGTGSNQIPLHQNAMGNTAPLGGNFSIDILGGAETTAVTDLHSEARIISYQSAYFIDDVWGTLEQIGACEGCQFWFAGGNVAAGRFHHYGYRVG